MGSKKEFSENTSLEVVKKRLKWSSIPDKVHDEYYKDLIKARKVLEKKMIPINTPRPEKEMGIMYQIENSCKFEEFNQYLRKIERKYEEVKKSIHNKHYAKYGIKFKE